MKTCIDCKNCKISYQLKVLWCSENQWLRDDLRKKIVGLSKTEITLGLPEHRLLFQQAEECLHYEDMT